MTKIRETDERFDAILEMIGSMASLDFSSKIEVDDRDDVLNAISQGLNWLCEEFNARTIDKSLYIAKNKELEVALSTLTDYKYAIDHSTIVSITDTRGNIIYVNKKFCDISKYTEQELLGQNQRIVNSGHHPKEFWIEMWSTIGKGKVWNNQIKNKAKDGSFYWVNTTIVPFMRGNKPYQYLSIRHDISIQKKVEQGIINSIIFSNEEKREYFAEDIHEGLAQVLTGITFQMSRIEEAIGHTGDEELEMAVASVKNYLSKSISYAKNLATDLMPRALIKGGLLDSLEDFVTQLSTTKNKNIHLYSNVKDIDIEKELEITLYRTIESMVNQAVQYPEVTKVDISISGTPELKVQVVLFGRQNMFNSNGATINDMYVLSLLQKRIELYDGKLFVHQNEKEEKTTIDITVNSAKAVIVDKS